MISLSLKFAVLISICPVLEPGFDDLFSLGHSKCGNFFVEGFDGFFFWETNLFLDYMNRHHSIELN